MEAWYLLNNVEVNASTSYTIHDASSNNSDNTWPATEVEEIVLEEIDTTDDEYHVPPASPNVIVESGGSSVPKTIKRRINVSNDVRKKSSRQ